MTLGEKLKMHRTGRGLSQEKVAELVGVSRQAVTKWENNQTVPSTDNLMALASIYQISLDDLAEGRRDGRKKEKEILHANLTLIGIILQTAFLNAAMQPFQLEQANDFDHSSAERLEQLCSGLQRAAGGDEVVNQHDAHARLDVITVYLDGGGAVLQLIGHAGGRTRQLAGLADRDERLVQLIGDWHAEQEPTRFQSRDDIKGFPLQQRGHLVHGQLQAVRVADDRGDVPENHAPFGKIRDTGDIWFDFAHVSSFMQRFLRILCVGLCRPQATNHT